MKKALIGKTLGMTQIFDESGMFKSLKFSNWKDDYLVKETCTTPTESYTQIGDDLPF